MTLRHHAALERSLTETEARLQALATPTVEIGGDEADQRTARQNVEDTVRERARLEVHRRLCLSALTKVELGRYGVCEDCRNPISEKRLNAMPWATLCLGCQAAEEIRAEQFRSAVQRPPAPTPDDEEGAA